MRQRFMTVLLCATALYLACGCIRDYDFKRDVTPHIVVNSILDPDSVVKVDMWWSKKSDESEDFSRITGAKVTIYENDQPLLNATSGEETMSWDYSPKEGATYTITVNYPDQAEVRATTTVPLRPQIDCELVKENRYRHYAMTRAEVDPAAASLIITWNQRYDSTSLGHLPWGEEYLKDYGGYKFTANSILIDPFNRYYETYEAYDKGGTDDYSSMMRIPIENIAQISPLAFAVKGMPRQSFRDKDWWFYPEIYPDDYQGTIVYQTQYITFTAASKDYDLYHKTLLQYRSTEYESNTLMSQAIYRVHTNVENGIGIFAAKCSKVSSFAKPTEQSDKIL